MRQSKDTGRAGRGQLGHRMARLNRRKAGSPAARSTWNIQAGRGWPGTTGWPGRWSAT